MALERKDSVGDTTATEGTGTLTIAGVAVTGFLTFAAALTDGSTVRVRIQNEANTEWEVVEGVWDAGASTLTRDTLYASPTGSKTSFSAGTKAVVVVMVAADFTASGGGDTFTPAIASLALTTSMVTVYTAGGNVVLSDIRVANIDGTNSADVTVVRTDASDVILSYLTALNTPIPAANAMIFGPVVLLSGQKLRAQASASGDLSLSASVQEAPSFAADLDAGSNLLTSTSMTTVYTAGADAECLDLRVANYDGTNSANITVVRADAADAVLDYLTASATPIGAANALLVGPVYLESGQKIRAQSSAASDLSVDVSVRERP